MTNEEAIKEFKERLSIKDYKEQIPQYYSAIELAISALEENSKLKAEIEQLKSDFDTYYKLYLASIDARNILHECVDELKAELEQSQEQWCLKASDNTDYVLAYADGMYCLSDSTGSIVCEFLKGKVEE